MSPVPTFLEATWGNLWKYIVGFASFPIVVRGSGLLLEGARKRWESASAAKRVVSTQLDPLLKAADELHGKLRSLAEEDFREFRTIVETNATGSDLVNLCSTLYLFAQFWGRLEILRRESFHAELTKNRQGKLLMDFLRCLESKHVRLVEALRTECSCTRSKNLSPIAALNIRREAMRRALCQLRGNPKPQPATSLSQQATITGPDLDHRRRTSESSK